MITEYGDPIPEFPAPGVPAAPIDTPAASPPEPDDTAPEVTSAAIPETGTHTNPDADDAVDGGVGAGDQREPDSQ
jgi:hypothetical protein